MDIEDRWAIAETLSRVGHVFDDGRFDEIDTVFTADVVYDMSAVGMPVLTGISAARELAETMGPRGPIAHFVSNLVITDPVDDGVVVDSKGLMLMADQTLTAVVHHDVLRREPTGWRIARRRIVPQRVDAVSSDRT
ncbi:nuclear transport factor 2 family protein [Curtobacterium sp. VKM Ac-2865]|uniref:nuclear transport factor 2 family protein n=1 Tax=Curtobacterium sp. VKM Ac-2865 TaxID=2783817 RepID=UPI00188AF401|nr:nuclear transport factor 2 family protein [Curtobacterium sp. VKM Ac-2865]MBF4583758.1 nuclear transport factor 2 family protein [Curtobacterium sp. VKM Ac-2865]